MPHPSEKGSKIDHLKKTPMNYVVPDTNKYLHASISKLHNDIPDCSNNTETNTSKGKLKHIASMKQPTTINQSSTQCGDFYQETEISTEENEKNPDLSCHESKTFRDFDIGEPSRFQHLRIDFTPIKGIDDNVHLQQKCIDFWEFVKKQPMLIKNMAVPVKVKETFYEDVAQPLYNQENRSDQNIEIPKPSAIQWTKELPLNYLGKLSHQYCPETPSSYKFSSQKGSVASDSNTKLSKSTNWTIKRQKGPSAKNLPKSATRIPRPKEETKKVCAEMEEFDRKHPRNFDPPTPSATLITAKMQRLPSVTCAPLSTD